MQFSKARLSKRKIKTKEHLNNITANWRNICKQHEISFVYQVRNECSCLLFVVTCSHWRYNSLNWLYSRCYLEVDSKLTQIHKIKPRRWGISLLFLSRSQHANFSNISWLRFSYNRKSWFKISALIRKTGFSYYLNGGTFKANKRRNFSVHRSLPVWSFSLLLMASPSGTFLGASCFGLPLPFFWSDISFPIFTGCLWSAMPF